MEFTIDAQGKMVGRIASEAAHILMGKNSPTFEKNKVSPNRVRVINAGMATIDEKRSEETVFARYSGYPGGFKEDKMSDVIEKKGVRFVIERAIGGMIPNNKLKKEILKHLEVSE
ncbi:MAG TPA: uL13 family ribosomal protein [Candidatus Paceibacterota bacterium]|nr:uL13 family ribosomal protein [Candidatus Paceibacterota bacterium]